MTKTELVKLINTYPGPEVTDRPRKATLQEILLERIENQEDTYIPTPDDSLWSKLWCMPCSMKLLFVFIPLIIMSMVLN